MALYQRRCDTELARLYCQVNGSSWMGRSSRTSSSWHQDRWVGWIFLILIFFRGKKTPFFQNLFLLMHFCFQSFIYLINWWCQTISNHSRVHLGLLIWLGPQIAARRKDIGVDRRKCVLISRVELMQYACWAGKSTGVGPGLASISLGKVGRTSNTSSCDWFGSMCSWGVQACQNGRKAHFCITQWYKEQRQNTESVVMVSRWEWYHRHSVRRFRWPQIDHIFTRVVCTDLQSYEFSNRPD